MIYQECEVQLAVNQPLCHFLTSVIYESTTKGIQYIKGGFQSMYYTYTCLLERRS